jgi:thiol:disulfide interchange protein
MLLPHTALGWLAARIDPWCKAQGRAHSQTTQCQQSAHQCDSMVEWSTLSGLASIGWYSHENCSAAHHSAAMVVHKRIRGRVIIPLMPKLVSRWSISGITVVVLLLLLALASRYSLKHEGLTWETYSEQKFDRARRSGKPVLIDFHADWCVPCKQMEETTFKDRTVVNAAKDIVRMKVDMTNFDSPEKERLSKRFNIYGLPALIFLTADGTEAVDARLVGFAAPEELINSLRSLKR